jgi:hypothetical protein
MAMARVFEETLAVTLEHVKALHATLSAVVVEVAALREAVLVESQDSARFRKNLKAGTDKAKPLVRCAMQSYDEIIQRLAELKTVEPEDGQAAQAPRNVIQ